jgi:hypothetical protein
MANTNGSGKKMGPQKSDVTTKSAVKRGTHSRARIRISRRRVRMAGMSGR